MRNCPCHVTISAMFGPVVVGVLAWLLCVAADDTPAPPRENTALTSYINLERQFALESELTTLFGILLHEETRGEAETELDLEEIGSQINQSKLIHKTIGANVDEYLSHPFNAFHLIKRLYLNWTAVLSNAVDRKIQHKALRFKLDNLRESFPTENDFSLVSLGLTRMQYLTNLDLKLLVNGTINGKHSLQKPTLTDLFQISRVSFDQEDYYSASLWLREALKICQSPSGEDSSVEMLNDKPINATSISSLLASSLYEMRQYAEAIKVLNDLLAADPYNKRAKVNKKFFEDKLKSQTESSPEMMKKKPEDEQEEKYEKLCQGKVEQSIEKTSRLYCYLHPTYKRFFFGKAEILSLKPRVVVFHDLVGNNVTEEIKDLGIDQMLSMLDHDMYKYEVQGVSVHAAIKTRKQNKLRKHFEDLKNLVLHPTEPTVLEIRNFGVQGFFLPLHGIVTTNGGEIGSFLLVMNDNLEGGNIVFPLANITTTMKKGSVLFWYATKMYPAICPISYGSLWVASVAYYESKANYCRMTEKRAWDLRWRPRRKSPVNETQVTKPDSDTKL